MFIITFSFYATMEMQSLEHTVASFIIITWHMRREHTRYIEINFEKYRRIQNLGSALKQITAVRGGAICPCTYITRKRFGVL